MIFSQKKGTDSLQQGEAANSLLRVVHLLLDACVVHAVELDVEEHAAFRTAIRGITHRFDEAVDHQDLLILAGEANKTIQAYSHFVTKLIRALSHEKQLAVDLLAQSLLKVCHASEKSGQTLRHVAADLAKASELQDVRELRNKMSECVDSLCVEAAAQEAQHSDFKGRVAESSALLEPRDPITGLGTMRNAESRIKELGASGYQGYVLAFFLKNIDVVNRRFGFAAGDGVLQKFAKYLEKSLQGKDELFRWRGPCFVIIADRFASLEAAQSESSKLGVRGPEQEVESEGKSMLIRLTSATAAFPIPRGRGIAEIVEKVDQFAAEQFKISPPSR